MPPGDLDLWHFVCDDRDGSWTWRRVAPDGDLVAQSLYTFQSFNVCVADAERAGFLNDTAALRRVRASKLEPHPARDGEQRTGAAALLERRRRPRPQHADEDSPG